MIANPAPDFTKMQKKGHTRQRESMKKIACFFPGVTYTFDRPLLYYSWELLDGLGWEIVPVRYGGFSRWAKRDMEMIMKSAYMALEQSEEILRDIDWSVYEDFLFVGNSIGTIAGSAYARRHDIDCRLRSISL